MTTAKIEGTLMLDGLIEGRLSSDLLDIEDKLTKWVAFSRSLGLGFNLDVSGSSFSVLAKSAVIQTSRVGSPPENVIAQTLQQLMDIFPQGDRQEIFSTLRSVEIRKGEEIQALYPVGLDGTIRPQTRHQTAKTISSDPILPTRQQLLLGGLGLLGAFVFIALLSFFVDFRGILHQVVETSRPLDSAEISIDAHRYQSLISVEIMPLAPVSQYMILRLRRTEVYPTTEQEVEQLWNARKNEDLASRLTIESLAQGYIRCELYDTQNNFLKFHMLRVKELLSSETIDIAVPLPEKSRVGMLLLTY